MAMGKLWGGGLSSDSDSDHSDSSGSDAESVKQAVQKKGNISYTNTRRVIVI